MTLFARCASSAALLMVWLFAVDLISVAAQESESTEKQEQLVEEDRITPAKNEPVANEKEKKAEIPPAVDVYMGRRVAQTMHYLGAEWLIRNEREREERCSMMLANLGIKPGMTICDMGCGNGFYTLQMAQLTGENGYVVGVDVQPEMLSMLRTRMEDRGIENIVPILGSYHDPRLPPQYQRSNFVGGRLS